MRFAGSPAAALPVGEQKLPGRTSYLLGNERDWIRDVPNYSSIRYDGVYPGIDAVFYGNQKQLEYDFVLKPGADPDRNQLAFDGAPRIGVDETGNLESARSDQKAGRMGQPRAESAHFSTSQKRGQREGPRHSRLPFRTRNSRACITN